MDLVSSHLLPFFLNIFFVLTSFFFQALYMSFDAVSKMSGAGWDETAKMVSLPPSVWRELSLNKSTAGCDLSCWQNCPFPLFHKLKSLIEGNVATGELMESTADSPSATQQDVGNDIKPESNPEVKDEEEEEEGGTSRPALKSIQTPAKRK
jgi:TusA-related sulfurtransferase